MFRPTVLSLSAAHVALLLSACNPDPHPAALRERRADGSPWLVRYSYQPEAPRSLDPQEAYDQMSRRVLEPVYDCLLEYHPFKTDPYTLSPCMLEQIPVKHDRPDGRVSYLCTLKSGIFFHDDPCFPDGRGREVVAADVRYAWQRIADPATECPVVSSLWDYVAGLKEAYETAQKRGNRLDYSAPFPGVEVVDSRTFKVHLLKPYPQIVYWMAMHFTCPVAREAVEYYDGEKHRQGGKMVRRERFKWHPVGTGPFRYVHELSDHDQNFRLARNERYTTTRFPSEGWAPVRDAVCRPLAGAPLPIVDEVQIRILRETIPAWLLTKQGYLDHFGVSKDAFSSVVTATHELTPELASRGMQLDKDVDVSTFFTSINMEDAVLGKNKKLRQALACAFDAATENEIFFNGVREVAQQLLSPGIPGFRKDHRNPNGFNLAKAQRLIAEAGYRDGIDPKTGRPLEIALDTNASGSDERLLTEFEQKCFERLGIKVNVIENTFAKMLEKEDKGNFQLASGTGWGADYPDPENYMMLFYSRNTPPAGKNISRYRNPEFDRLFEQMATMENSPARMEIVHRMVEMLNDDCPVIFTNHKAFYSLVQPWAPRTHNNMMIEGGLKYLWVDPVLREQKRRDWNRR
jgi:ABC-type transport system substrate-binding protein